MIRRLHPHSRPQRTNDPAAVPHRARELGYEPRDWPVRTILYAAPLLFALPVVAMGTAALTLGGTRLPIPPDIARQPEPGMPIAPRHPGGPPPPPEPEVERAIAAVLLRGWE